MSGQIEARLRELGETLPSPPPAVGHYLPVVRTGNLVITSGQLPWVGKQLAFVGKLGGELHEADGRNAARLCALNALAQIKACVGDLDKVTRIVRVEGNVHSAPGFHGQAQVLNGASEFLVELFGDKGKHTRTALGIHEMPLGAAVQLSIWAEVED
ncbi:MAG: RidA family protein [Planctomycetaceae bacterium]